MQQANKATGRYPDFLLMGWVREDGDVEALLAMNGDQIEDDELWNSLVELNYFLLVSEMDQEIECWEREELTSVITNADEFTDNIVEIEGEEG